MFAQSLTRRSFRPAAQLAVLALLAVALLGPAVSPVAAQQDLIMPITANEYITYLTQLNEKAYQQTVAAALEGMASLEFTTQLDALRTQGHAAQLDTTISAEAQGANEYITQLDALRQLETVPMLTAQREQSTSADAP